MDLDNQLSEITITIIMLQVYLDIIVVLQNKITRCQPSNPSKVYSIYCMLVLLRMTKYFVVIKFDIMHRQFT